VLERVGEGKASAAKVENIRITRNSYTHTEKKKRGARVLGQGVTNHQTHRTSRDKRERGRDRKARDLEGRVKAELGGAKGL